MEPVWDEMLAVLLLALYSGHLLSYPPLKKLLELPLLNAKVLTCCYCQIIVQLSHNLLLLVLPPPFQDTSHTTAATVWGNRN